MCPPHAHTDCCRCSPDRRSHDAWSVPANCPCPRRAAQSGSIAPPLLSIRLQIIISGLCRRTCVSVCVRVCVPECVNWFFAGTCGGSQRSEKGHRASQFQVCCTYPCAHNTLDYALEIICLVPRVRTQMTQHCCACVCARARALNTLCKHPPEWIYKEQKKIEMGTTQAPHDGGVPVYPENVYFIRQQAARGHKIKYWNSHPTASNRVV